MDSQTKKFLPLLLIGFAVAVPGAYILSSNLVADTKNELAFAALAFGCVVIGAGACIFLSGESKELSSTDKVVAAFQSGLRDICEKQGWHVYVEDIDNDAKTILIGDSRFVTTYNRLMIHIESSFTEVRYDEKRSYEFDSRDPNALSEEVERARQHLSPLLVA